MAGTAGSAKAQTEPMGERNSLLQGLMPGAAQGRQGGSPREVDPDLGTEIPAENTWKEPRQSEIKGKRWSEAVLKFQIAS